MLINSSTDSFQPNLFGTDLLQQLDPADPLLQLAAVIPWRDFELAFSKHYTQELGAPGKPIRLMVGLLLLKQLEDLSDESVVLRWKRNPYYQSFCGMTEYQPKLPCHSTELVHFRHVKKRAKARKALKRLRTIAHILVRELRRRLPCYCLFECHQKDFLFYERVLAQKLKDKNKIYSLHEPQVYCIAKGKDHKQYEYGNKVSIASTAKVSVVPG